MTIEVQTSNIKLLVESISFPYSSGSLILERDVYHDRWTKTAKKLEFLIKTMKDNRELLSSHWTSVEVDEFHLMNLGEICTAIGLYQIWAPNGNQRFNTLWNKLGHDDNFNPAYWWDFMGDTSIMDEGGYVAVLLSDEGVEYMNRLYADIRSLVPHCSYTTTE